METEKKINLDELAELVDEAIFALTSYECSHCGGYIGPDTYLDKADVKQWIEEVIGEYEI